MFDEFDDDNSGTIDRGELRNCLAALGAELAEEDVKEMFAGSQLTAQGELDFKEFLVALSLGSVLQLFPSLRAYSAVDLQKLKEEEAARRGGLEEGETLPAAKPPSAAAAGSDEQEGESKYKVDTNVGETAPATSPARAGPADTSGPVTHAVTPHTRAKLQQKGRMLVEGLKIVLEAYCLFDQDGSGTIDKDEVLGMIAEASSGGAKRAHGASQGTSAMLSSERWSQLDWDDDGSVTLREFISAFYSWVGLDDDDEDNTEYDTAAPEQGEQLDESGKPVSLEDSAPTPARVPPPTSDALQKEEARASKPRGGAFRKKESWTKGSSGAASAGSGGPSAAAGSAGVAAGSSGAGGVAVDEHGRRVSFDGRGGGAAGANASGAGR